MNLLEGKSLKVLILDKDEGSMKTQGAWYYSSIHY